MCNVCEFNFVKRTINIKLEEFTQRLKATTPQEGLIEISAAIMALSVYVSHEIGFTREEMTDQYRQAWDHYDSVLSVNTKAEHEG